MILVNGRILVRTDTTESWEYTNPVLPDRQLGFERSIYGEPIGMKMGNGLAFWNDLPYWFIANSGGGGRAVLLPSSPLISQDLSTGVLTINWSSPLFNIFGNIEASFKVLVADGYDYVRAPYWERFEYTGANITNIVYNGFFDTDYKIIVTL